MLVRMLDGNKDVKKVKVKVNSYMEIRRRFFLIFLKIRINFFGICEVKI